MKQYYCDVNIEHLISFNEELAHRLSHEPAEIIPLVRNKPRLPRSNPFSCPSVRKRIEEMHPEDRVPLQQRHRHSRAPALASFNWSGRFNPGSRRPQNILPSQGSWDCHWSFCLVLESNCAPHTMQALPSIADTLCSWRVHWCLPSQVLRQAENAKRGGMPPRSFCRCS